MTAETTGERFALLKKELDRIVDDINRQNAELDRRLTKFEEDTRKDG